jgi:hypothetical protein
MYLGVSVENFITIGLMLLVWMIVIHMMGQFGMAVLPSWARLGVA